MHPVATVALSAVSSLFLQACGGPSSAWTARTCASNASGNCRGIDDGQPHRYVVKSSSVGPVHGTTDVQVKEPACAVGIGEVDVQVVDADDLNVTVYCLVDAPGGTMTLPASPPTGHSDASGHSPPRSTDE